MKAADEHMEKTSKEREYVGKGPDDVIEVAFDKLAHITSEEAKKKKAKRTKGKKTAKTKEPNQVEAATSTEPQIQAMCGENTEEVEAPKE